MRVAPFLCPVPRMLKHPSVRLLWLKYCSGDSVQASTFLSGVEQFLVRFENMDAASAAELMGPSAPSRTALAAVLDVDYKGCLHGETARLVFDKWGLLWGLATSCPQFVPSFILERLQTAAVIALGWCVSHGSCM